MYLLCKRETPIGKFELHEHNLRYLVIRDSKLHKELEKPYYAGSAIATFNLYVDAYVDGVCEPERLKHMPIVDREGNIENGSKLYWQTVKDICAQIEHMDDTIDNDTKSLIFRVVNTTENIQRIINTITDSGYTAIPINNAIRLSVDGYEPKNDFISQGGYTGIVDVVDGDNIVVRGMNRAVPRYGAFFDQSAPLYMIGDNGDDTVYDKHKQLDSCLPGDKSWYLYIRWYSNK